MTIRTLQFGVSAMPAPAATTASSQSILSHTPAPTLSLAPQFSGRTVNPAKVKLITGRSNRSLAEGVAKNLSLPLTPVNIKDFANGETYVNIEESVRNSDVFILQSTSAPANQNLMELLLLIDAAKRNNAKSVTAVVPHYGYARQDRRMPEKREPITAKLVATLLKAAGADRVVSMDMHSDQLEGFFDMPVDHLSAITSISDYLTQKSLKDVILVSPDVGGAKRTERFAKKLGLPFAVVEKRRSEHNKAEAVELIGYDGNITGKTVVLVDDMIDTAGTICASAKLLKDKGAKAVVALATHGLFSQDPAKDIDALANIRNSVFDEVIVTNTIPLTEEAQAMGKIRQLDISPILAEAVRRVAGDNPDLPDSVAVVPDSLIDRLVKVLRQVIDWFRGLKG